MDGKKVVDNDIERTELRELFSYYWVGLERD